MCGRRRVCWPAAAAHISFFPFVEWMVAQFLICVPLPTYLHTHMKQRLYAKLRVALKAPNARLVFDGEQIGEQDTPEGLEIEDEYVVEVLGL